MTLKNFNTTDTAITINSAKNTTITNILVENVDITRIDPMASLAPVYILSSQFSNNTQNVTIKDSNFT